MVLNVKLGELVHAFSGGTPSRSKPEYFNGNVPWVKSGDLNNPCISEVDEFISEDAIRGSSAKWVESGSVLIAMYGATAGKVSRLRIRATTNQAVLSLNSKDNDTLSNDFLFWLMNSVSRKLVSLSQGAAQPNLSKGMICDHLVSIPNLIEQQKIAATLSTWDRAIELHDKLIALKEKQKQGLMQVLLTGKKRLLDDNGVPFSGIWETVKLGEISKITTGSSNRQDSTLTGEYAFFDRSVDVRTSDRYLFDADAVIVPGEGQDFVPKYFSGKFDLHQRTYAIMDFSESYAKFIFYKVYQMKNYFLSNAVGSTVKSLRLPMFLNMKMTVPPLKEQVAIADVLSVADKEIDSLKHKRSMLHKQKQGLMQQLLG